MYGCFDCCMGSLHSEEFAEDTDLISRRSWGKEKMLLRSKAAVNGLQR